VRNAEDSLGSKTETFITPDEEYDFYAKPENQVPQGARGAGRPG
jgi:hypothetical protein